MIDKMQKAQQVAFLSAALRVANLWSIDTSKARDAECEERAKALEEALNDFTTRLTGLTLDGEDLAVMVTVMPVKESATRQGFRVTVPPGVPAARVVASWEALTAMLAEHSQLKGPARTFFENVARSFNDELIAVAALSQKGGVA